MEHTNRHPGSRWRISAGRLVAVTLAIGGLSVVALAPSAGAASSSSTTSMISTTKSGKLGTILVSDDGSSVYTLKASTTACDASCLAVWFPVTLTKGMTTATAGPGVDASKLGTVPAAAGALQVTYGGKALYWYAKDTKPGQVHNNLSTKWGKWSAVVTAKSSSGSKSNAGTGGTSF